MYSFFRTLSAKRYAFVNALYVVCFLIYIFISSINDADISRRALSTRDVTLSSEVLDYPPLIELLQGAIVHGSFTSEHPNLGIVWVRFDTHNRINSDVLTFRIREDGSEIWLSETEHTVDQFQPHELFPFGFPIQASSKNREYEFLLESQLGRVGDAVSIDYGKPVVQVTHQFRMEDIRSRPVLLVDIFLNVVATMFGLLATKLTDITVIGPGLLGLLLLRRFQDSLYTQLVSLYRHIRQISFRDIVVATAYAYRSGRRLFHRLGVQAGTFFEVDTKRIYQEFDGLRAWAIICVISTHLALYFKAILSLEPSNLNNTLVEIFRRLPFIGSYGSAMGVNLFFILSSFLIYGSLIRKPSFSIVEFMKRRYARLLPAHLAVLIPLLVHSSLITIVLNMFFLAELFAHVVNANILTWTMTYEMFFYLTCALFVRYQVTWPRLKSLWVMPMLYVFLLVSETSLTRLFASYSLKYFDIDYLSAFLFGVFLAQMYFERILVWKRFERHILPMTWASLLFVVLYRFLWYDWVFLRAYEVHGLHAIMFVLNTSLFFVTASMLTSRDHLLKKLFRYRWLRYIGIVSYSTYLAHLSFGIPIAARIILDIPSTTVQTLLLYPMSILVSVFIGTFLFHYLEKPYFTNRAQANY